MQAGHLGTIFKCFDTVASTVEFVKLFFFLNKKKGVCVIFQAVTVDVLDFPSKTR